MLGKESPVFAVTLGSLFLLTAAGRAELNFSSPNVELGKVRSGKPLRHTFNFINQGAGIAEILEVRASCGCLAPVADQSAYQPGEKGELVLEINPLSQPAGRNSWTVTVRYADGKDPVEATLRLSATLVREVDVQPTAITFVAADPIPHEITVTDLREKSLNVHSVDCSSAKISGTVNEASTNAAGRRVWRVRIEMAPNCPDGRHDEAVLIRTNDSDYPEFKVPITIVKQSASKLSVLPGRVSLTASTGQAIPSQLLRVRSPQNETVIIDQITADHPAVVSSWAPGPGTMATVKVTVDRGRIPSNELQTHLHIHVRTPVREVLTVPVNCTLR